MDFSKIDFDSIAQDIDMGLHCYVHKKTRVCISFPDPEELYDNRELWEADIQKVEANPDDYIRISKMNSTQSFQVMEDFTQTVKNKSLQSKMQKALDNRKPFRNWNNIIHHTGEEREDWFKFKQARMEIWVKCQIEEDDEVFAEKSYLRKTFVHLPALTGISKVVYHVDDIDKGVDWYTDLLNMHPTSQSEKEASFMMDNQELAIQKREDGNPHIASAVLVYWNTENVETVINRLIDMDGVDYIQSPKSNSQGIITAIIEDPWGNAIGLMSHS